MAFVTGIFSPRAVGWMVSNSLWSDWPRRTSSLRSVAGAILATMPWCEIEDVKFAVLEWGDWFSHHRRLELIGYLPPAEFEEARHRARQAPAEPVGVT